jgi:hypothetical protein
LQRADEKQVSLARYAREQGLVARQLYGAKTWLVKVGVWPRGAPRTTTPSEFVAVCMPPGSRSTRCRLSHLSGWSLESDHWPEVSWLRSVVDIDATA